MKICLPCPGLEHIQRGFESYTRELFEALKDDGDIHLVKASGQRAPRVHVVPSLRRTSGWFRLLPQRWRTEYRRVQIDCWTFAFAMLPLLLRERFDVIHFSETQLGDALKWLKKRLGFRYRLILSNGAPWPPEECRRFEFIHQVSPAHQDTCLRAGVPRERQSLVPYGFHARKLTRPPEFDRDAARRTLGISSDEFVILSLAALNNSHKRIKWLIDEFAALPSEFNGKLLLVGNREQETPEIEAYAARVLKPESFIIRQVPHHEVPALLWCADAMVQCSLDEGFGRTLVEAMLAEVPLLVHPHPTAHYLVTAAESFCNMEEKGKLAEKLRRIAADSMVGSNMARQNLGGAMRFDWKVLRSEYIAMYHAVGNSKEPIEVQ